VTFIETPIYGNEKSKTISLMREYVNFNFSISFLVGTNTNNSYYNIIIIVLLLYSYLDRYFAVVYDTLYLDQRSCPSALALHLFSDPILVYTYCARTVWYGTYCTLTSRHEPHSPYQ